MAAITFSSCPYSSWEAWPSFLSYLGWCFQKSFAITRVVKSSFDPLNLGQKMLEAYWELQIDIVEDLVAGFDMQGASTTLLGEAAVAVMRINLMAR